MSWIADLIVLITQVSQHIVEWVAKIAGGTDDDGKASNGQPQTERE